ncbi:hypothetical protein REC12_12655 [Desulfosporosinus sp. PR]|uniref:hypothetical protein n=1 Tax=Candidatus Desulfosporosinus nitrosoreducens TaxID=3401928 RepID=UPI0027EA73CB|nr:hypothetical protein [Desulfosporosinus sp. PR]MDQ7094441.1 hypothetical protein [Desulfosporosinus sp. PR]
MILKSILKVADSAHKVDKMKDSITIGLLGGLIGAITSDLTSAVFYKAKKTEATFSHTAAQFFVTPTSLRRKNRMVLGQLLHLSVGSVLGIPLVYILKKTGKDHYLSKGLTASLLTWIILYHGGQKFGLIKKPIYVKTHHTSLWSHIIYGLTSAKAIVWLADPAIFTSSAKLMAKNPSQHFAHSVAGPDAREHNDAFTQSETPYLH